MTASVIDIGSGFTFTPTACAHGRYGFIVEHQRDDIDPLFDGRCAHSIPTCEQCAGGSAWQVLSEDPLTLSPSLLLTDNGDGDSFHGWVRDGRWVVA